MPNQSKISKWLAFNKNRSECVMLLCLLRGYEDCTDDANDDEGDANDNDEKSMIILLFDVNPNVNVYVSPVTIIGLLQCETHS